jgi:Leucine-rich repeat (LRR) protein
MDSPAPSRAVLTGIRDSLNTQGRLYGHRAVSDFAAMEGVISILRGQGSSDLTPDEVHIILHTHYGFSQLTDEDAEVVGSLRELRSIALFASPLGLAGMKSLSSLPQLAELDVGDAKLKRGAYAGLAAMTQLRSLNISGDTKFGDAELDALLGLCLLEIVKLVDTGLTDAGISKLSGVPSIVEIELPASVTDAGLSAISTLPRLRAVRLSSKTTDEGVRALAAAVQLERVRLVLAKITDESLRMLSRCTHLRVLDVSRCSKVTDQGVSALAACTEIEELNLSGTKLTGRGLTALSGLQNLKRLHLQGQKLTDEDVPALAAIRSLNRVMLGRNQFTGAGFATLRRLLPGCDINTLG